MRENDETYFARRAAEERLAAGKAVRAEARNAHLELAERYQELARALEAQAPLITLKVVNG